MEAVGVERVGGLGGFVTQAEKTKILPFQTLLNYGLPGVTKNKMDTTGTGSNGLARCNVAGKGLFSIPPVRKGRNTGAVFLLKLLISMG